MFETENHYSTAHLAGWFLSINKNERNTTVLNP